ncbi:hypothetical protein, partial [Psychrobacillus vulpis]|uniref:hypothetical protein n=1 Tax=Psychrobacillus vulpis TaxID=2325572 RepID=UPI00197FC2C0
KFFARGKRAVSFGKLRGNFIKSETIWTFSVASGKGAVSTIFLSIGIFNNLIWQLRIIGSISVPSMNEIHSFLLTLVK